jgi:hypothetical protein
MDEAKRKGLEKLKESLILAAEDMDQATAAAVALRTDTSDDDAWTRALETAMAVSYMRPFTTGAWKLPGKYVPRARAREGAPPKVGGSPQQGLRPFRRGERPKRVDEDAGDKRRRRDD